MHKGIKFPLDEIAIAKNTGHPGRPTIVFLHDSLGCIRLWRDFPQTLGRLTNCNVLVYDRQGYGKSPAFTYLRRNNNYMEVEADILDALLNFWKIDHAILFGHSDGASIALLMAAKHPQKILGVVTEGAHIFVEDITVNGIKEAEELYQTSDLKQKLEKYHGYKTDDMFRAWAETWTSKEFSTWNIEHFLPSIKCPLLVIQGENDQYGTLNQVDRIMAQTGGPAAKLVIPEIGHTPHKEAPDRVLAESAAFINSIVQAESNNTQ